MKVFTFSFNDNKGGAAISAYRLYTLLRNSGIDMTMYVARKFTNDDNVIGPTNNLTKLIQLFKQKFCQLVIYILFNKENCFISPSLFNSNWHKFINKSNVDIVHLHWVNLEFFSIKDISKINKPIIWTLHDMWAFSGSQHLVWNDFYQGKYHFNIFGKLLSNLDYWVWKRKLQAFNEKIIIVTPSNWLANCAQKSSIFKNNEIFVIPNPINIDEWRLLDKLTLRENYGFKQYEKLILFSSAEDLKNYNKGFDLLLASLSKIPIIYKFKLLILGQSRPNWLNNYSFDIIFLGKAKTTEHLNSIYRLIDFVVLPSRQENLSNVAIEALLNQRPVIAFDHSGNSDIIKNGISGILIEPYNILNMSKSIIDLLLNTDKCLEYGLNGRNHVINTFDNKIILNKYLELYNYASKRQ
jgi:glycosyltransferase involved in cell wall biosynthesis